MRLGLCIERLIEDRLRIADPADGFVDGGLALYGPGVGVRGLLCRLGAQLVRLPCQGFGLRVFPAAGCLPGLSFQLGHLRDGLLGLPARILRALGFARLRARYLGSQVHGLAGALAGLVEFAVGQGCTRTGLVFRDLAFAVLLGLVVR